MNFKGLQIRIRGASYALRFTRGFWFHWWTPVWHEGRGPYITIGCGLFAFYRGY